MIRKAKIPRIWNANTILYTNKE